MGSELETVQEFFVRRLAERWYAVRPLVEEGDVEIRAIPWEELGEEDRENYMDDAALMLSIMHELHFDVFASEELE